jgi:esterase/lipase
MDKELFILFAAMATKNDLIERMENAISNYKEAKLLNKSNDEIQKTIENILVVAHMFIVNHDTNGDIQGAMEFIKKMNKFDKNMQLFDISKSVN